MGKVYLVGAGTGNEGLITAYGKELIEKANCIIYDRLIGTSILDYASEDCEKIYVGKANHKHIVPQEQIQSMLLEKAQQYEMVVRLKGGDPYVFGRGAEEALFLYDNGAEFEVVSGVSSVTSALAYAGIPVTKRGVATGFRVFTAHTKDDIMNSLNFSTMLEDKETLIFLMGLRHIGEIAAGLINAGRSENTPIAVISNATTPQQKKCIGTLKSIDSLVKKNKLTSPSIIVIGEVVGFNKKLNFYERKRLFGRKIFVPYIEGIEFSFSTGLKAVKQSSLANELTLLGATVIPYKTGKINCIPFDTCVIKGGQCLVFTSKNAVYSVFSQLGDIRKISNCKIACVGKKTANAINDFGIEADIVSKKSSANDLAEIIKHEKNVIYFSAKESAAKFEGERIVCYENAKEISEPPIEAKNCDSIIFTCASNVRRTINKMGATLPEKVYSIGPSCSKELKMQGITSYIEAEYPSIEKLIELL